MSESSISSPSANASSKRSQRKRVDSPADRRQRGGILGDKQVTEVEVQMRGHVSVLRDGMHIVVYWRGVNRRRIERQVSQAGFFAGFAQSHLGEVGFVVRMTADLQPAPQPLVKVQEDTRRVEVDD